MMMEGQKKEEHITRLCLLVLLYPCVVSFKFFLNMHEVQSLEEAISLGFLLVQSNKS